VNDVLAEQPENPFQAMAERLAAAAEAKTGKKVGGGAAKAAPGAAAAVAGGDDDDAAEAALVAALKAGPVADSFVFVAANGIEHGVFVDKVLKKLKAAEQITTETTEVMGWEVTEEGSKVAESGSPEYLVWKSVPVAGISRKALEASLGADMVKNGMNTAMKLKLLSIDKATKDIKQAAATAVDTTAALLKATKAGTPLANKDGKDLACQSSLRRRRC
jgi:hypothetical protein